MLRRHHHHHHHRHRMVLITGGRGFLGRHVTDIIDEHAAEWAAPDSMALDVRDRERLLDAVADWKPDVIIHLAYRRNDPATIVGGSANVAEAAAHVRARLVHLSTDMVFAGRPAPYVEADTPDALGDYGQWKADAEHEVTTRCPGAVLVRTSLLYGTDVLAPWQLEVRDRQPVTWYEGEFRSATYAGDVAAAVAELTHRTEISGPLHVAAPEAPSRAELAQAMASWMRLGSAAVRTSPGTAPGRPGHLALDSSAAASAGIHCRPLADVLR